MSYSNATFYMDYENGSDSARTALTSVAVANNGSGLVRCTKAAHGLVTGAVVDVTLNYAGAWMVTVIDSSNFDLIGSTYSTSTAVTVNPRGGASKADAWKTITNGAASSRIAAGDTIRLMASPDPTLVGNATWTQYNKTITLATAVTTNITDCETAWTASANVTCTADTTQFRENTKSMKAVIATAFTTGLVAYFPTGTLNLSGYQQVSFMLFNTVAIAASTLSLRLCSDTAGVTTVHTIPLPAVPSVNYWLPVVVDLGTNMNSAIQSVALYQDVDIAAVTIQIDNIIACKASSSADALTHQSLIGKASALPWAASTAYVVGDGRKPTSPNRNGFRYVVTVAGTSGSTEPTWPQDYSLTVADGGVTWSCIDQEESWHPLQAINGTTLILDGVSPTASPSVSRGYDGATETVATWKRETIKTTMVSPNSATINLLQASGTTTASITYVGGWNRTDMTTQSGETWFDPLNGNGYFLNNGSAFSYITVDNINLVRHYIAYRCATVAGAGCLIKNSHYNYGQQGFQPDGSAYCAMKFVGFQANGANGITGGSCNTKYTLRAVKINSGGNLIGNSSSSFMNLEGSYVALKNALGYGLNFWAADINIRNLVTANNNSGAITISQYPLSVSLVNALMGEATPITIPASSRDRYVYSQNHQQIAGNHYILTDGGTIVSATDQRHSGSGISWKFSPTSTNRGAWYPLRLAVAKIACVSGVAKSVQIWTRRDNTNIVGTLKIAGGQLAGVGAELTATCAPTVNTWALSTALTFTPTDNGVVEITFECYDGVGTTNNFWVDDLVVS